MDNTIEMLFDDVHCEKNRVLSDDDDHLKLLGIDWVGIVVAPKDGNNEIRYSRCNKIFDVEIQRFLKKQGKSLFQNGKAYAYEVVHDRDIFFDIIPIRIENDGSIVLLMYGRRGKEYLPEELEWAYLEAQLTYQKVLVENNNTQLTEYLEHVINLAEIITIIYDKDLKIVTKSDMAKVILKDGSDLSDLQIEGVDHVLRQAKRVMLGGENRISGSKVVTKVTHQILEISIGPFHDSTGLLVGGILIAKDVTERKINEYETEQQKLFSMVGDTVAMLAHDVNNPLMNVRSGAQIMLHDREMEQEEKQKLLNYIIQEADRIESSINSLYSYIAAVQKNACELIQLNDILRNGINIVYPKAKDLKVEITVDLDKRMPYIKVQNLEMQQVFARIMFNALEAMPEGGTLHVASLYRDESGEIEVQICDSGIGMTLDQQKNIFRPYFTTKKNGHGLGLYTSKNIVERYGGQIMFKSEFGKGTVFRVLIPVSR